MYQNDNGVETQRERHDVNLHGTTVRIEQANPVQWAVSFRARAKLLFLRESSSTGAQSPPE
jgi:hypothetical protein